MCWGASMGACVCVKVRVRENVCVCVNESGKYSKERKTKTDAAEEKRAK